MLGISSYRVRVTIDNKINCPVADRMSTNMQARIVVHAYHLAKGIGINVWIAPIALIFTHEVHIPVVIQPGGSGAATAVGI